MKAVVLGARGSTPTPGRDFEGYGGNTSCVAVAHDGAVPTLVLDAGTGIRGLAGLTGGRAFAGSILLGHLHWDHIIGLPFASALDDPASRVDIRLPEQGDGVAAVDVMSRMMSPPFFPIDPLVLRGSWSYAGLPAGRHVIEGFEVLARDIPHKGGRTFGYRVSDGSATLAYLSDHWPISLGAGPDGLGEYHDAALELCHEADLVLHDSQCTVDDFARCREQGHSAIEYAVRLCEKAGARRLVMFHHDPRRTDDEIDGLVRRYGVEAAAEGMVIDL